MSTSPEQGAANYGPLAKSGLWALPLGCQAENGLYISKGCKNKHTKYKNNYETQTIYGPRILRYLLSDPLWRKFADLIPLEDGH